MWQQVMFHLDSCTHSIMKNQWEGLVLTPPWKKVRYVKSGACIRLIPLWWYQKYGPEEPKMIILVNPRCDFFSMNTSRMYSVEYQLTRLTVWKQECLITTRQYCLLQQHLEHCCGITELKDRTYYLVCHVLVHKTLRTICKIFSSMTQLPKTYAKILFSTRRIKDQKDRSN